jgi:hypothetical protein
MIIPLTFITDKELNLFTVRCLLRIPRYHILFGNVNFIVDTGSATSFIGETDADRIRIPIKRLEREKGTVGRGLAGGAIELYKLTNVKFSFLNTKTNQVQRIQVNKFHVGKSASPKAQMKIRDSILGNDFLIEYKLKFVANPHSDSYLESV